MLVSETQAVDRVHVQHQRRHLHLHQPRHQPLQRDHRHELGHAMDTIVDVLLHVGSISLAVNGFTFEKGQWIFFLMLLVDRVVLLDLRSSNVTQHTLALLCCQVFGSLHHCLTDGQLLLIL